MRNQRIVLSLLLVCSLLSVSPAGLFAEPSADRGNGDDVKVTMDVGSIFQPKTHVSGGGDVTVTSYSARTNVRVPLGEKLQFGLGLNYEFMDFNFSNVTGLSVADPWNKIHRFGVAGRFAYKASPHWTYSFTPIGQYAGEEGADAGKSLLYGGAVGAAYTKSKDFTIGLGVGVFYRLEQAVVFPSLAVNWNITDRLHLVNPFRLGPAGPAGLELAYDLDKNWGLGLGGGYRSYRFRLDANGTVPSGIGQTTSLPVYLAVSRKFGESVRLHAYGGAAFAGNIRIEDRSGNKIDSTGYSTAPLLGLTLSAAF